MPSELIEDDPSELNCVILELPSGKLPDTVEQLVAVTNKSKQIPIADILFKVLVCEVDQSIMVPFSADKKRSLSHNSLTELASS